MNQICGKGLDVGVINSMQVWPDPVAGLREIRRVIKIGGRIALGFTLYSGLSPKGLTKTLRKARFRR